MNSIVSDLTHLIEGEVSCTEEDLIDVSHDFGGIIVRQPRVVVRPRTSKDIAKVVQYAAREDLTVSSRAAGHSLYGQALNQDGILLDLRSLNQIHEFHSDQLWFRADAGATWKKVVDAALLHRVIPPVLTNNFEVTLGGTHAAGGLGQSSFRYGTQADNCLGLEVVTATGDVLWCTSEQNSELFHHVLCGYGQFGIITQVKHQLRRYRPFTRTYFLCYDDLDLFLHDERLLIQNNRVDGFLALFSPCTFGVSRADGNGLRPLIEWFYRMQITVEADSLSDINDEQLLSSLKFYRHIHTEDLTFNQFAMPVVEVPRPSAGTANPWVDMFLPASIAKEFIETALRRIPSFIDSKNTPIGSFAMTSSNTKMPMFPLPKEELIIGFGMYPTIPKSQLQPVLKQLNQLTDLCLQLNGKRYMVGCGGFDLQQWQLQFGDYWSKVNYLKSKYDPKGMFNPDFFLNAQTTPHKLDKQPVKLSADVATASSHIQSKLDVVVQPVARLSGPKIALTMQTVAMTILAVLFFLILSTSLLS